MKIQEMLKRNPCKECLFYSEGNNVCQSKKVATAGVHPYVNFLDRFFCEPYKGMGADNESSD